MHRAAVCVPSNISEEAARTLNKEFFQLLSIARGSLSELETQIIIIKELGYIKQDEELLNIINKVF
jgi:four helix bundle protein